MTRCVERNCTHEGKWAPKINVPAMGWSLDQHSPISSIITIELCEKHKENYKIDNFINDRTPEFKEILEIVCRGRCPPDFDRAWLSRVSINSPEYIKAKAMASKNEH